jgi:hypothetical protein
MLRHYLQLIQIQKGSLKEESFLPPKESPKNPSFKNGCKDVKSSRYNTLPCKEPSSSKKGSSDEYGSL